MNNIETNIDNDEYAKMRTELETFFKDLITRYPDLNVVTVGIGWVPSESLSDIQKRFNGMIVPRGDKLTIQQAMQTFETSQALTKHAAGMLAQSSHILSMENEGLRQQIMTFAPELGAPPTLEEIQNTTIGTA